jgi:hypothetical protein
MNVVSVCLEVAGYGKTVESFRIALEGEISHWSGFARALRKPDREVFGQLKDMCNKNGLARLRCGNNIAYAWQVQTRGADETSTQFLRFTSCNYTFREST